jgi:ribonuclease HI
VPWLKARFKGSTVLARCEADGTLRADGGRVEIRYRPTDAKAYRAAARNLAPVGDGEILPDDACAEASAAPERGAGGRGQGRKKAPAGPPPPPPEGAIVAYTDGACSGNPGPSGVGVVLIDGDSRRELSAYLGTGTNNIAELTAIGMALEAVDDVDRPVRVYTDSQYAIGVLTKGWKAKANRELIAELKRSMGRFRDLQLVHVRGHMGIALNERADMLAVDAVQQRESPGWVDVS